MKSGRLGKSQKAELPALRRAAKKRPRLPVWAHRSDPDQALIPFWAAIAESISSSVDNLYSQLGRPLA